MSKNRKRNGRKPSNNSSIANIEFSIGSYKNEIFHTIEPRRLFDLLFIKDSPVYAKSSYGYYVERKDFKFYANIDGSITINAKAYTVTQPDDVCNVGDFEVSIIHLMDMYSNNKTKSIEKAFIKHFLFSYVFSLTFNTWISNQSVSQLLVVKLFKTIFNNMKTSDSKFLKYDKDNLKILFPLYVLINTMGVKEEVIKKMVLSHIPEDFKIVVTHSNVKSTNYLDWEHQYSENRDETIYESIWNSIKNKKFCISDISKMNEKKNFICLNNGSIRPTTKKVADPRKWTKPLTITRLQFKTKLFHESIGL